jgi:hypothetical protein
VGTMATENRVGAADHRQWVSNSLALRVLVLMAHRYLSAVALWKLGSTFHKADRFGHTPGYSFPLRGVDRLANTKLVDGFRSRILMASHVCAANFIFPRALHKNVHGLKLKPVFSCLQLCTLLGIIPIIRVGARAIRQLLRLSPWNRVHERLVSFYQPLFGTHLTRMSSFGRLSILQNLKISAVTADHVSSQGYTFCPIGPPMFRAREAEHHKCSVEHIVPESAESQTVSSQLQLAGTASGYTRACEAVGAGSEVTHLASVNVSSNLSSMSVH